MRSLVQFAYAMKVHTGCYAASELSGDSSDTNYSPIAKTDSLDFSSPDKDLLTSSDLLLDNDEGATSRKRAG